MPMFGNDGGRMQKKLAVYLLPVRLWWWRFSVREGVSGEGRTAEARTSDKLDDDARVEREAREEAVQGKRRGRAGAGRGAHHSRRREAEEQQRQ